MDQGFAVSLGAAIGASIAVTACVHDSQSKLPRQIAAKCQTPVSWVVIGSDGKPSIRPPPGADYKKVDCILGQLRPDLSKITFIGNEALPQDHPVERARAFCKATNVLYDASGPTLTIRFGGNNPEELSRQANCMRDKLKGTGFNVASVPAQ